MTLSDVAAVWRVSTRTLRRMLQDGRVPPPVSLSPLRWRRRDIDTYIARMSVTRELQTGRPA